MAEYIEREALIQNMQECKGDIVFNIMATGYAFAFIENAPAADVVEVVHGEWEVYGLMNPQCSLCRGYNIEKSRFCPNCGAKMDGDKF